LEPLPGRLLTSECPHCGRETGADSEPKALDLRFEKVEQAQGAMYRRILTWGVPGVAAVAIFVPLLHVGAVVLVPFVVVAHLVVVRFLLVRDAQRLFGPVRRILNRWMIRFAYLWIGLPGYGAMAVPLVGIALGAGTFVVLTMIAHVSTAVGLQRERSGEPLSTWEKAVPAVLAVATVLMLVAAIGLAVVFGWTVAAIAEKMQSP